MERSRGELSNAASRGSIRPLVFEKAGGGGRIRPSTTAGRGYGNSPGGAKVNETAPPHHRPGVQATERMSGPSHARWDKDRSQVGAGRSQWRPPRTVKLHTCLRTNARKVDSCRVLTLSGRCKCLIGYSSSNKRSRSDHFLSKSSLLLRIALCLSRIQSDRLVPPSHFHFRNLLFKLSAY